MSKTVSQCAVIVALLAVGGCSASDKSADASSSGFASLTSPSVVIAGDALRPAPMFTASSSAGGTLKETLTGAAINGVVPQGQALADESRFQSGGDTFLTVQVKTVNLPDGTALGVSIDFKPLGSITLAQGAGTLTVSLGHFGVSRDQVTVKNGGVAILSGGFFR